MDQEEQDGSLTFFLQSSLSKRMDIKEFSVETQQQLLNEIAMVCNKKQIRMINFSDKRVHV